MCVYQKKTTRKEIRKTFHMASNYMDQITENSGCLMVHTMKSSQVRSYPPSGV